MEREIGNITREFVELRDVIQKRRAWRYAMIRSEVRNLLESTRIIFDFDERNLRGLLYFIDFDGRHLPQFWSLTHRGFTRKFLRESHETKIDQLNCLKAQCSNVFIDVQCINPQWRKHFAKISIVWMPKELGNIVYLYLFDPTLHKSYFRNRQLFGTTSKRNAKLLTKTVKT